MELGRIYKTQCAFNQSFPTSWLIDKFIDFYKKDGLYDTVELTWVFSIIFNGGVFPVSFYIMNYPTNYKNVYKSGFSFTDIKRKYANRGYTLEQCNKDEFLCSFAHAFEKEFCNDGFVVEFENSIHFKAQSTIGHDSVGYGRTNAFYIVGAYIDKNIKES